MFNADFVKKISPFQTLGSQGKRNDTATTGIRFMNATLLFILCTMSLQNLDYYGSSLLLSLCDSKQYLFYQYLSSPFAISHLKKSLLCSLFSVSLCLYRFQYIFYRLRRLDKNSKACHTGELTTRGGLNPVKLAS